MKSIQKLLIATFMVAFLPFGNSQTLIKKGYFSAHPLGNCYDSVSIAKIIVDPSNSSTVKIVSMGRTRPFVAKSEKKDDAPKSTKAKIGGFLKAIDAQNKAYDANAKNEPSSVIFAIQELDYSTVLDFPTTAKATNEMLRDDYARLAIRKIDYVHVHPNVYNEGFKYSFEGACQNAVFSSEKGAKIFPINEFYAKFPELDYTKDKSTTYELDSKGDGLLGTKNSKCMVVEKKYHRYLDSISGKIRYSYVYKKPLKEAESAPKLANFMVINNTIKLDENIHFSIARSTEGRWGNYEKFRVVTFNKEGDILNIFPIDLKLLKDIHHFDFVYNKKGEKVGVLLILSNFTMIGGKSQRDPKDNNHWLYYFGLDGKEKYHYEFEHGESDNPRGINPVIVFEENDQLRMYNGNNQKLLKPFLEGINFDSKGKGTFNTLNPNLDPYFITRFGSNVKLLEDGNFLFTAELSEEKTEQVGAFQNKYRVYNALQFAVMSPDFELLASGKFDTGGYTSSSIDYIGKFEGSYKFVLTTPYCNYFISRGAANTAVKFPETDEEKKLFLMPFKTVDYNYTVDKENRKIYAAYNHSYSRGLSYFVALSF